MNTIAAGRSGSTYRTAGVMQLLGLPRAEELRHHPGEQQRKHVHCGQHQGRSRAAIDVLWRAPQQTEHHRKPQREHPPTGHKREQDARTDDERRLTSRDLALAAPQRCQSRNNPKCARRKPRAEPCSTPRRCRHAGRAAWMQATNAACRREGSRMTRGNRDA